MKFTINKDVLLDHLTKAMKIIDIKTSVASLLGVYIEVGIDSIIFISSNRSLSYKGIVTGGDIKIEEPGKILIKPKYIIDILRKTDDENVVIYKFEDSELTLKTPNSQFKTSILDYNDFPLIGFKEKGETINIDSNILRQTINEVIFAVEEWNKKVVLTGVNLKIRKNEIIFSATDMFRISKKTISIDTKLENEIDIIIPYKTMVEISKILNNNENVQLIVWEGYIILKANNYLLQSKLIDGKFPNIFAAIPTDYSTKIIVEGKKIYKIFSKFHLIQDVNEKQIINIELNETMKLRASIFEIGQLEESFSDFELVGEQGIVINFNIRYLLEAIKTLEDGMIELRFISSTRPVVISEVNNNKLEHIILPTYLNS